MNHRSRLKVAEKALAEHDHGALRAWVFTLTEDERGDLRTALNMRQPPAWLTPEDVDRVIRGVFDDDFIWFLLQIVAKHALPTHAADPGPHEVTPSGRWNDPLPWTAEYRALVQAKCELLNGMKVE